MKTERLFHSPRDPTINLFASTTSLPSTTFAKVTPSSLLCVCVCVPCYSLHRSALESERSSNSNNSATETASDNSSSSSSSSPPSFSRRPFSFPVAMLCYRVANKLKSSTDGCPPTSRDLEKSRKLFRKCLELLDERKYPDVHKRVVDHIADTYLLQAGLEAQAAEEVILSYASPNELSDFAQRSTTTSACDELHASAVMHLQQAVQLLWHAEVKKSSVVAADQAGQENRVRKLNQQVMDAYLSLAGTEFKAGRHG